MDFLTLKFTQARMYSHSKISVSMFSKKVLSLYTFMESAKLRGLRGFVGRVGQSLAWVAWVHKVLVWVAWVEILAYMALVNKIVAWMVWVTWIKKNDPCYLITLYRKHYVFCRIWFKCTNRIQQALQLFFVILDLFRPTFIQIKLTCV